MPERQLYLTARIGYLVCPASICMECHARLAMDALAQRLPSLADGDLFRAMGGENENARCGQVCVGIEAGTAELSALDRTSAARGAEKTVVQGSGVRDQSAYCFARLSGMK